jgi:glucose/arabinose dehydrogenase
LGVLLSQEIVAATSNTNAAVTVREQQDTTDRMCTTIQRVRRMMSMVFATAVSAAILGRADVTAQLRGNVYASGFTTPVAFVQDPVDRAVQFVVQQDGHIRVIRNGAVLSADFLDLSAETAAGGERGLLGLAFAPGADGRRFFVNFTDRSGHTVVARFRRAVGALVADPASRFDLRWNGAGGAARIEQPFANHNGGHLAFGPDTYLYIGLGDGGSGDDPGHRAQTLTELLGKMLRIDVGVADTHPTGYQIPPDNPFVSVQGVRPEIWSVGLRNPWRYSFDDPARGGTGALVIGDVGQSRFEEVDYEPRSRGGRNYGWRNREGAHDNIASPPPAYQPLVEPIFEYGRTLGASITGGYVYRGRALGLASQGRYFFADFVSGRVFSIALAINPTTGEATSSDLVDHTSELGDAGNVSSFGVDGDGELYVVSYSNGTVVKLLGRTAVPAAPTGLHIIR